MKGKLVLMELPALEEEAVVVCATKFNGANRVRYGSGSENSSIAKGFSGMGDTDGWGSGLGI